MAIISIILDTMRRPKWFKCFVLMIFTFIGYWFGRRGCNYAVLVREEHNSTPSKLALQAKTAKFNREARKYALQRCCPRKLSFHNLPEQELKNVLKHIIVDRKNKLLYCYIPEVTSTDMKKLMLTLQNFTNDSNSMKHFDNHAFEFLSDVAPDDRDHMVKTFFKFLFVRNPLARILSAYRNKFQNSNAQFQVLFGRDIVRKYRKSNIPLNEVKGNDVTLQEFVRYLIDKENDKQNMNEHWMPMYQLCQPCYVNYDFVGSFENLYFDTSALLAKLHASGSIAFPKKQSFYKKALSGIEVARLYKNITLSEYKSLHKRYIDDFNCFIYKFVIDVRNMT